MIHTDILALQQNLGCSSHRRTVGTGAADPSDDDDDAWEPPKSKTMCTSRAMNTLVDEVQSVKETLLDMMSLGSSTTLPLGLKRLFRETFKCHICHSVPIRPPVIVTRCCKQIIGCQDCVNTWYSGPQTTTKTCPMCRADRGCYETMMLRGLSDLMESLRRLCGSEDNVTDHTSAEDEQ